MKEQNNDTIPIRILQQTALEINVPQNSSLREYLGTKDETSRTPCARKPPKYEVYNQGYSAPPKVLLVLPPMCMYEGAVKRLIPPLGLCYIAANMLKHGYEVDILDCIAEGYETETLIAPNIYRLGITEEEFAERIESSDHDVICFSMIYSSDIENLYRYAKIVKQVAKDKVVMAGGMHASIYPEQFIRDAGQWDDQPVIDFVIRGEGEFRLIHFIENLQQGRFDIHADGLVGWHDGDVFINPQYTQIQDLNDLPFPAYHKLPLEKYFHHNVPFSPYPRGNRVMQIYTSRGCPIGCTFCSSTNFNKAYRSRSVENVIEEIKFYQREYGIDEIQFADDNLTFDKKRSIKLFNELEKLNIQWCTPNGIMINTLDEQVLDAMIRSGLYQITLSLDSGNADTLREKHRKPVKLQRVPVLMDYLKKRGVLMHGTLVVGMPGETVEDIEKGFRYVETLPFNSMNVFIAQALPGSELFEVSLQNGAITYETSLYIDTAQSTLKLTDIDGKVLEALVENFLSAYNRKIYQRDTETWNKKYQDHQKRMAKICIGKASANTSAIIEASNESKESEWA
ncbi:Radical SAM [Shewanella denitrificans OS217]|jgi:anaerobic magnesium-protoporphyrin IX monomethyl ester cyclase|uniref:Radical SAM n=1 Tax=Shewanella denitrificans (strain OS217 / ATCC BAA-1090 / DSM 15013) TaxID=318161 RepID=Q12Q22_SHEDO|nr:Sden_1168 family B12-binding radical SAM P-methyltransferase [Shewanella denitrificans]ABE54454.1 Radical SAM [Shewanella denitrificans OS217]